MRRSVKIADLRASGALAFDLIDLITLLGERALDSAWRGYEVWTVQEGDNGRFEELCGSGRLIAGADFVAGLKLVIQVIDGRFEAFEAGSKEPWVVVEAIDSSYFLLHAEEDVIQKAHARFRSVADYSA